MSCHPNLYSGVYGPRRSTKPYLEAPITTLKTERLPARLDFLTANRGRPLAQGQTDAWDFSEAEFQLLELRGDGILYDELPGILSKSFPNIDANGISVSSEPQTICTTTLKFGTAAATDTCDE